MSDNPLLPFFKAMADANRLRIVGLLAARTYSVDELAEVLGLRPSTVSHHLARLGEVGLLRGAADGHYHAYSLDTDALQTLARTLLAAETLTQAASDVDADAWDRKVLATFLGPDGRLTALPAQRKKFEAILRHVLRDFTPGTTYTEREVSDKLRAYSDDVASLRRGLIDHRFMARAPSGSAYWRIDSA